MGRAIVKIKDKYLEWSSIVDAPLTWGMTLDELKEYIKAEYGSNGLLDLKNRLSRIEEKGTSYIDCCSVEDVISFNRAGPYETDLTKEQLYTAYCERKEIKTLGLKWKHENNSWYCVSEPEEYLALPIALLKIQREIEAYNDNYSYDAEGLIENIDSIIYDALWK
jgi:hypothetical protein